MALNVDKLPATVIKLTFEKGYVLAVDADGTDYFIFHSAVERMGRFAFEDLQIGSRVRLTPIDHPRGARGIEVQIVEL